ncbi:MAG: hypothetical protein ALAOOOJD_02245 [bacterium]|nr:hypothetical protein [bacterium]
MVCLFFQQVLNECILGLLYPKFFLSYKCFRANGEIEISAFSNLGMRLKLCSYLTLAAFIFLLLYPPGRLFLNDLAGTKISSAASLQPTSRHHCACKLNTGECHCRGTCCNSSGEGKTAFCQTPSPLAASEAPRLIPAPTLKEFLSAAQQISRHVASFDFVMPLQQEFPSTWCAPPDTPPPRFLSAPC